MLNVLFFPLGSIDIPSSRYRLYQYLPLLDRYQIRHRVMNGSRSGFPSRVFFALKLCFALLWADVVFIQKDIPTRRVMTLIRRFNRRVVFDLDDAIWTVNTSRKNGVEPREAIDRSVKESLGRFLTHDCSAVIAGNTYLADFCGQYNRNVFIVPTVIDVSRWRKTQFNDHHAVTVIGWIGTGDNLYFVEQLRDVFTVLHRRYGETVVLKVICNRPLVVDSPIHVVNEPWSLESEVDQLGQFDIGIMPLEADEWTRGKCGLKVIQYMSMGIPLVASPVGVNGQMVEDGVDGFLADTQDDWVKKLSMLIENTTVRHRMRIAGRKKVEQSYSLGRAVEQFAAILKTMKSA